MYKSKLWRISFICSWYKSRRITISPRTHRNIFSIYHMLIMMCYIYFINVIIRITRIAILKTFVFLWYKSSSICHRFWSITYSSYCHWLVSMRIHYWFSKSIHHFKFIMKVYCIFSKIWLMRIVYISKYTTF